MFLRIISECVEPGEHACIALPRWLAAGCCWNGDLLQGFPLRSEIGPGIVIGRVEAHMAEPASDDRNVDARRDEVHGGGVPEGVWRHMLGTQRWRCFGGDPRFRRRSALDRDVEDFDALRDRCGILGGHEVEEAADRSKPAVARADRTTAFMFGMAEERDDLAGCQIGQCVNDTVKFPTSGLSRTFGAT